MPARVYGAGGSVLGKFCYKGISSVHKKDHGSAESAWHLGDHQGHP